MSSEDTCKRTALRVTIPEPEVTNEKKLRCSIDQQEYDNREDYESHCKEDMMCFRSRRPDFAFSLAL